MITAEWLMVYSCASCLREWTVEDIIAACKTRRLVWLADGREMFTASVLKSDLNSDGTCEWNGNSWRWSKWAY